MPSLRPVTLLSHLRCLDHDTGGREHPETPGRLLAIEKRLRTSRLRSVLTRAETRAPAERSLLLSCHDESYLFRFEEAALAGRSFLDHPDNQIGYDSYEAALLAAGAGVTGVDLLEKGATGLVFCAVRPPGHHAERAAALGFCFLNNVVLAARYWQQAHGRRRVMIIDWDAHHGNGIQAAFEKDPEVFYCSIHEHPTFSFPGSGYAEETGLEAGSGTILNIPLPPGADDALVRRALDEKIGPALERFQPEVLIVAAGFDGHQADDMSGLAYSTALYHHLGQRMVAWADRFCRGRVLTLLEGGYHLEALADGVEGYLRGLAGEEG